MAESNFVFGLVLKMSRENQQEMLKALDHLGICTVDCLCGCTRQQLETAGLSKATADEVEAILDQDGKILGGAIDHSFVQETAQKVTGAIEEHVKATGAPPRGVGDDWD